MGFISVRDKRSFIFFISSCVICFTICFRRTGTVHLHTFRGYKLAEINGEEDSCCLRLSATWATTPAPALWNHSFFTWIKGKTSHMKSWTEKHFSNQKFMMEILHGCYCGRKRARVRNESWHQLFSIPLSVNLVSFPLLTKRNGYYCLGTIRVLLYSWHTIRYQQKQLPSMSSWYSTVFCTLGAFCAASFALAASGGKLGPSEETGGQ